ncbi:MAG: hypothetical protein FWG67_07555 [Defluviitaleaceae bacterium]|nr:hypothetical protein [Defluviitaleaceae bacterium]
MNHETYAMKKEEILSKSNHKEICKSLLTFTQSTLEKEGLKLAFEQTLALTSHLCAMVERGYEGGEIPEVDPEMFSEVSALSLELAEKVCKQVPNMVAGEAYLLSVHFELAQLN